MEMLSSKELLVESKTINLQTEERDGGTLRNCSIPDFGDDKNLKRFAKIPTRLNLGDDLGEHSK